jgi:hypothetical protein
MTRRAGYRTCAMDGIPIEPQLRAKLETLGPEVRSVLRSILDLTEDDRARRIGELYADAVTRPFAELLIDLEVATSARPT